MYVVRKNGNGVTLAWITDEPFFGQECETLFSGYEEDCILFLLKQGFKYSGYHDYWLWLSDDDDDEYDEETFYIFRHGHFATIEPGLDADDKTYLIYQGSLDCCLNYLKEHNYTEIDSGVYSNYKLDTTSSYETAMKLIDNITTSLLGVVDNNKII